MESIQKKKKLGKKFGIYPSVFKSGVIGKSNIVNLYSGVLYKRTKLVYK